MSGDRAGRRRAGTLGSVTDTVGSALATEPPPTTPAPARRPRPGVPFLPAIFLGVALLVLGVGVASWWHNREATPGAVDIGFYDDMSTHHLQAIRMANIYTAERRQRRSRSARRGDRVLPVRRRAGDAERALGLGRGRHPRHGDGMDGDAGSAGRAAGHGDAAADGRISRPRADSSSTTCSRS